MVNGVIEYVNGRAVHRVWTIEMIREEISRLDEITGLHGLDVQCIMKNVKSYLGQFDSKAYGKEKTEKSMLFTFSRDYFTKLGGTGRELSRLNNVRHEYAHYYTYMLLDEHTIHGKEWKKACEVVDCVPELSRSEDRFAYLEHIDALYPDCIPFHPSNPMKDFRMSFEDALWAVKFHPIFGRAFLEHLTVVESPNPEETQYRVNGKPPKVQLKVERVKNPKKYDYSSESWIYEPKLDTYGNTYEEAIIELAYNVLKLFRW